MGKPPGYGGYGARHQDMPFLHRITFSSTPAPAPVAAIALSYPELSSADVLNNPAMYLFIILIILSGKP